MGLSPRPHPRSRPRPRLASLSLAFLFAALSCVQGAKAPSIAPTRTLGIGGEPDGRPSDKEFGIVFSGPRGDTVDPSEVTLVWNRPMRPLELAGDESSPPAKIVVVGAPGAAAPRGRWQWMGIPITAERLPPEKLMRILSALMVDNTRWRSA